MQTGGVNATPQDGEIAATRRSAEEMFLQHYGLNEQPFGVTPDPRFLYLGTKHLQALTALTYGTSLRRGFLTLIARPGMGKTSLLFHYLGGLRDKARTAFVFQTDCDSRDFMRYLLADLGLDGTGKDLPEMRGMLNEVLLAEMRANRRFVLVIDEAQNLDERGLESIRLLSNFETPWAKLMQIVLAGQPQLAERLASPSMAQLRQRVSFATRIEPFAREEVDTYVAHRLRVAGYTGASLFSFGALGLIAKHSEGIPRNINNMCFCAMSLGWATKSTTIDELMMREVLADLDIRSPNRQSDTEQELTVEPERHVTQRIRFAELTVTESHVRGWLPRVVVASAVLLFVLGWTGVQLNIGKRVLFFSHATSAIETRAVVPTSTPVSIDPEAPADPVNPSLGSKPDASVDGKYPASPNQVRIQSPVQSQERN
jgi:general secretion pathway protein A